MYELCEKKSKKRSDVRSDVIKSKFIRNPSQKAVRSLVCCNGGEKWISNLGNVPSLTQQWAEGTELNWSENFSHRSTSLLLLVTDNCWFIHRYRLFVELTQFQKGMMQEQTPKQWRREQGLQQQWISWYYLGGLGDGIGLSCVIGDLCESASLGWQVSRLRWCLLLMPVACCAPLDRWVRRTLLVALVERTNERTPKAMVPCECFVQSVRFVRMSSFNIPIILGILG